MPSEFSRPPEQRLQLGDLFLQLYVFRLEYALLLVCSRNYAFLLSRNLLA